MSQDSFGSSDLCKALFKNAVDLTQKLADLYRQTKVYSDVTSPQAVLLRGQLKDMCLRIMLESPCEYGSRVEDFAWRKVFYEPIQLLKKFQRRSQFQNDLGLATAIKIQVLSAMGFYQNLLIALQSRYSLDLRNIVDIPVVSRPNPPQHFAIVVDKETRDAAIDLVYRALVCLGNLARYQCDYLDDWSKTLPTRYYLQALMLKPDSGLPHNQLALLAGSRIVEGAYHWLLCLCAKEPFVPAKRNLFDVLGRVHKRVSSMRRTPTSSMKAICSQLVAVVYQFLALSDSHRQITEQNIENLRSFSDFALSNFRLYLKKHTHQCEFTRNANGKGQSSLIPSDLIFKVVVVFQALLYLLEKAHEKTSKQNPGLFGLAVIVSLNLFTLVIRYMRDRMSLRTGLEQFQEPKRDANLGENQTKQGKSEDRSELKRPRRRRNEMPLWNEFESDENEEASADFRAIPEEDEEGDPDSYFHTGATEDNYDDYSLSSGESSELGGYESSTEEKVVASEGNAPKTLPPFEAFCDETWSPALKILCDWLASNRLIVSSKSSEDQLWQSYCDLVNIILPSQSIVFQKIQQPSLNIRPELARHLESVTKAGDKWSQFFVLPEDRAIGRFRALSKAQVGIEMSPQKCPTRILNFNETITLRFAVILHHSRSFTAEFLEYLPATGRFTTRLRGSLPNISPPIKPQFPNYGLGATQFYDPDDSESESGGESDRLQMHIKELERQQQQKERDDALQKTEKKERQMRAMAELWLKSEISRLEKPNSSALTNSPQTPIYACLVSDLFLSLQGVRQVKSLLQSQRIIVALPHAIIAHLDSEKSRNEASREASRFIEQELRRGSTYLRIYNQSSQSAKMGNWQDYFGEYRTLPAVFAVVRQLLSENVKTPSISRCLIAIVSSSSLGELPQEVESFVCDELKRLPNQGACVQFKSIQSLLRDLHDTSQMNM